MNLEQFKEKFMINLRKITEENFIDAFNLKLNEEQEKYQLGEKDE